MKPNDIRRDIASRHTRSGSAPDIGRVSKLRGPDTPPPGGSGRVRHSRRGGGSHQILVRRWSIALGVGTFAVMGIAFILWLRPMLSRSADTKTTTPDREQEAKIASKFPSPSREEATDLVTKALANRDLEKVSLLFRSANTPPAAILDYCAQSEKRDGHFEDYDWVSSLDAGDLLVEGIIVNYKGLGDNKPAQRLALLTPDDTGRWQVDFDAFARIVTPSWKDILAGSGSPAQVRVMATPGVYYNGIFRDENVWTCYNLTSPDMDVTLCGYCRIGSSEAERMRKLFNDETLVTRVALEIRHTPDAEPRQFEISRLLSRDWVVPASVPEP